jgi:putative ABC transport system permease protein
MRETLYLAWRYLSYHRIKTAVLVACVAVIVYLPVGLHILVNRSAGHLTARAEDTPLLVGAKGSPLELVLNSLYFEADVPEIIPYGEADRINASGLASAIPLYVRFRAQEIPIVGTSVDYFDFRRHVWAQGRPMALLGECVLGSQAARSADLQVGDTIISSPETVFDLAGVYPLKMTIVGVLAPTGTPDDRAAFVDVKTAWIIEGLAHGHQDMQKPEAAAAILEREGKNIVANASVVQYNEITADNADTFHFHGDPAHFPITAVIAVPKDSKASTLLQGRYLNKDERVQMVRPITIIEELLGTVLTVQRYVTAAVVIIGMATLVTMGLVFMLSLQLRRREILTMVRIGGARSRIASILVLEIVAVLVTGVLWALMLSVLTSRYAEVAIRVFL